MTDKKEKGMMQGKDDAVVALEAGMTGDVVTVESEPLVSSEPSPLHPVTPSPPSPVPLPVSVDVTSTSPIFPGKVAQLFHSPTSDARFVGVVIPEGVRVARILLGINTIALEEGKTWAETIGDGFTVKGGEYVTLMAENMGKDAAVLNAAILLIGGAEEVAGSGALPSSRHPVTPSPLSVPRPLLSPTAPVWLILSRDQHRHLVAMLTRGRRPPSAEISKIQGRISSALLGAGTPPKERAGNHVTVAMTVETVEALRSAVTRRVPVLAEQIAALVSLFGGANKPPEDATVDPATVIEVTP